MASVALTLEEHFEEHHRYLLGVAYRLLGTVAEAEDALQETWLRTRDADLGHIRDVRSWLTVITTRICLDILKSARAQREQYVGEWLPEPVVDDADPAERITLDESVNLAMLVVLETLSPAERTAFVLHDVFGIPFDTIAQAVGRSAAACRQLAARARGRIAEGAPRFDADHSEHRRVVAAFAAAASSGRLDELVAVLDPDVVLRSDGGGKVPARREPLVSAPAVAALLLGIMRLRPETTFTMRPVNGGIGLVTTERGEITGVVGFTISAGRITQLHLVMNPDKLARVPNPYAG